jgi:hypothetical protein
MLRCLDFLRRVGSTAWQGDLITMIPTSAVFAGLPLSEVRAIGDALERDAKDAGPLLAESVRASRARSDSMAGLLGIDEARGAVIRYSDLLRQVGSDLEAEYSSGILVAFAQFEGPEEHEREARGRAERLEALGDRLYLANALADWAAASCGVGNAEQALEVVARGRALARADDIADVSGLNMSEAYARALVGDRERAEGLIRETHDMLSDVDMAFVVASARSLEAHTRAALGDVDEARAILTQLLADAERRGFVRFADLYRRDLAALDSASPD